ncbi:uncharacterized protein ACA1_181950, partial [Acanthamoeba castellanii str. Neff]
QLHEDRARLRDVRGRAQVLQQPPRRPGPQLPVPPWRPAGLRAIPLHGGPHLGRVRVLHPRGGDLRPAATRQDPLRDRQVQLPGDGGHPLFLRQAAAPLPHGLGLPATVLHHTGRVRGHLQRDGRTRFPERRQAGDAGGGCRVHCAAAHAAHPLRPLRRCRAVHLLHQLKLLHGLWFLAHTNRTHTTCRTQREERFG